MNLLQSKTKEVAQSLIPVVIFVGVLSMAFIRIDFPIVQRFFIGSGLVFFGLSIFLWGVDQSMEPIGYHMAHEIATSKGLFKTVILSFLLGFLITIAEPDVLILAGQVEGASGGSLESNFLVMMISVGVGVLISIASIRILTGFKYNLMMLIIYFGILLLGTRISEEFLAISFDSSGATTGALTTPFVLAISVGLSRTKGGKSAEENAFGMVGAMSAGPILAVMLISVLSGQSNIQGSAQEFITTDAVLAPIIADFRGTFFNSIKALIPIIILFFVFNFFKFKISRKETIRVIRGLIYTVLGLTLFLVGSHTGFMDMGRVLGYGIAEKYSTYLPIIGLILGMLVVLAEPAVHVLAEQVEDVTAGNIKNSLLRMTLSIGVGIAIALSMLKIMSPNIQLWFFILPGFLISIALSFFVDPIFTGIAFDAGGVASGPMAATFILAFAQGVADQVPTADVLKDGFGIIAMIAMTPIISIMVLGAINKVQMLRKSGEEYDGKSSLSREITTIPVHQIEGTIHEMIICTIDRGFSEEVIDLARKNGCRGATIFHGRDTRSDTWLSASMSIETEKEMIWFLVDRQITNQVCDALLTESENINSHIRSIFALPVSHVEGLLKKNQVFE